MTVTAPFGERLRQAMDRFGPLCVGIDPHPSLLNAWGLDDDPAGLAEFCRRAVDAFGGHVAAVKPQSAFFERHGSAGIAVLEGVVADLRAAGTLCVVDAKRGDIGSTMEAYADAYCGDGSTLAADAVTVSPFLGFASLRPLLDLAAQNGRGVFVLALTSNPGGIEVQHAVPRDGGSVAADLVAAAAAENAGALPMGSVGLVVGATVGTAVQDLALDLAAVNGPLLAPGMGAQGGGTADLAQVFAGAEAQVLAASSREVLGAGPGVGALRAAAHRAADSCAAALTGARPARRPR